MEQSIRQSMMIGGAKHFRQCGRAQIRFHQADRSANIFREGLSDTDADPAAAISMVDAGEHNHVRRLLRLQQEHALHKAQSFFPSQQIQIETLHLAMAFSVAVAMTVAELQFARRLLRGARTKGWLFTCLLHQLKVLAHGFPASVGAAFGACWPACCPSVDSGAADGIRIFWPVRIRLGLSSDGFSPRNCSRTLLSYLPNLFRLIW